jgi:hypothetical protein
MMITFSRTGERLYSTTIARDDNVKLRVPSYDRTSSLPHDLSHYVVERELRLRGGFWGSVAGGAKFPGMIVLEVRQRPHATDRSAALIKANHPYLIEAEVLVSSFMRIIDEKISADSGAAEKRLAKRWMPPNPDAREIKKSELVRVCTALLSMQRWWHRLAIGDTFVVVWPPGRK